MPIKLPKTLPAFSVLRSEGVNVMSDTRAMRQDIRPLRIALLNLMPKKIQTEIQFSRLIGATPLQIELTLIRMTEHVSKTTSADHIDEFYRPFADVAATGEKFDGLIVTGAPIEHLDYEDVTYWEELTEVFEWSLTHVHSTFGVCWGGMAIAYYFNGVPKYLLDQKAFGCFRHQNLAPASPLLRGFSDDMVMPVSRWTEIRREDIFARPELALLIDSEEVGPCLIEDAARNILCMFNHLEYDSETLKQEYDRDVAAGGEITLPVNYFPNDDPTRRPLNRWRSHAHLLFGNWINEIYQSTPFDLAQIGRQTADEDA